MALGGALLFGTVGFHLIEGWSLADSLYLTVQTLTTVGYGDLTPRNGTGRLFAVVVMLMGVGGVALAISTIVQSVVQSELVATFGQRRRSRRMSKLYDHFIICGSGRVGSHLVRDLVRTEQPFVVIENDQQRAAEFSQRGINVLVGDATLEESLREAGVERARGLAACLPNDADNVYVVLTARDLNPRLHIVARAAEETRVGRNATHQPGAFIVDLAVDKMPSPVIALRRCNARPEDWRRDVPPRPRIDCAKASRRARAAAALLCPTAPAAVERQTEASSTLAPGLPDRASRRGSREECRAGRDGAPATSPARCRGERVRQRKRGARRKTVPLRAVVAGASPRHP